LVGGLTSYSYPISNLYSGNYYYVVVAYNDTGFCMSNCINVFVDRNPGPLTMYHDAENPDPDGTFNLYWNESLGRDNFSIFISSYPIIELNGSETEFDTGIEDLTYLISNLPNGYYYFAVMAVNESGKTLSNYEFVNIFHKPGDINLTSNATNPDFDGIFDLIWNQSIGADNYSVFVSKSFILDINDNCEMIGSDLIETNFSVSGLGSDLYYYVVVAYNYAGNTTSNCIEIFVQIPPGDINLTSTATNPDFDGDFDLIWNQSLGADNYSVYVSDSYITEIDINCVEIAHEIEETVLSITSLPTGSYYYIVKATNNTGETLSNCINVLVMIPPGQFELIHDADNPDKDGTFTINWSMSLGAVNYSIYVSNETITEINENVILIEDGLTNFSYSFYNLPENRYFYVVIAYNDTGHRFSNCIEILVDYPNIPFVVGGGGGDNDDDNGALISFGLLYLAFVFCSIISLILLIKRKLSLAKNKK